MQVEKLIAIIDDHLISTGKRFIGLRAATNLLNAQTTENVDLKEILERNQIPHAYQTESKPRQWRIPHSNQDVYTEERSKFLRSTKTEQIADVDGSSPKFSFKHILILVILGYLAYYFLVGDSQYSSSNSTANESATVVNTQSFATNSKSDFDEMYEYVTNHDEVALRKMFNSGKITVLEKGTPVNLVEVHLSYSVIRQRGSSKKLWIASERVSTGK